MKRDTIEIELLSARLTDFLLDPEISTTTRAEDREGEATVILTVHARLKRTGMETKFVIDSSETSIRKKADHSLRRILAKASQYNAMVMRCGGKSIADLAKEAGVGRVYFARMLRLSFLAPDIVVTILRDRHPLEVTAKFLADDIQLPSVWAEQRSLLKLAP